MEVVNELVEPDKVALDTAEHIRSVGEGEEGERVEREGERKLEAPREGKDGEREVSQPPQESLACKSIYLDDVDNEEKKLQKKQEEQAQHKKPRRMTKAERARLEALESFGGSDFASMSVKKRDLREELDREKEEAGKKEEVANQSHKTRRELARNESLATFGGESFDSAMSGGRKRRRVDAIADETNPRSSRRMTRAERAKLEALQSFGGAGLDTVLSGAKKKVARTLEPKTKKKKGEEEEEKRKEGEEEEEEGVEGGQEKENIICQ